ARRRRSRTGLAGEGGRGFCHGLPVMRRGGGAAAQVSPGREVVALPRSPGLMTLVDELAAAGIGTTYNQYADSELRRERLTRYLESRAEAPILLVGEAAGYRGACVSGLAFTSERQLTGSGPAEASATIVHRVLAELGLEDAVLLWNVVPTHPGTSTSNRRPTQAEIEAARPFLAEVVRGRRAVPVGRLAASVLGTPYVRHPAHGGAAGFEEGLRAAFATIPPRRATRAPFPMRTYSAKPGEITREWYLVDAQGKTLGRLTTQIAG